MICWILPEYYYSSLNSEQNLQKLFNVKCIHLNKSDENYIAYLTVKISKIVYPLISGSEKYITSSKMNHTDCYSK